MNLSRRGILKMLPAMPLAARKAQQSLAEKLTGIGIDSASGGLGQPLIGSAAEGSDKLKGRAAVKLMRLLGLPDWKKREIRRSARYSRQLDPDIAALQSISLSAKLNIQWQRNEREYSNRIEQSLIDDEDCGDFLRKHNLTWF